MIIRHRFGEYAVEVVSLKAAFDALPSNAFVVTDANLAEHYGSYLPKSTYIAPPGEQTKSFQALEAISEWLAESGATRKSTLVAFGGGVIGDLAGLVAATYMRGIPYVQIPTSLLAQVDSSVGGKVAIDLRAGKNLFGAFYAPIRVSVPMEALQTLSERHFTNGAAEIWKYGAILDASLYERLEREPLTLGSGDLEEVILRCVQLKADVVEADEFELTGARAVLNFGHTIGHAIEVATGYGPILHGEAISIGMVAEARLGETLCLTKHGTADRLTRGLLSQGLPVKLQKLLPAEELLKAMYRDKKAGVGRLAFALLTDVGNCKLVEDVPESEVRAVLETL